MKRSGFALLMCAALLQVPALPAGETDTHESGRSDGPAVLGGPAEV